jgi:hypothetical protein
MVRVYSMCAAFSGLRGPVAKVVFIVCKRKVIHSRLSLNIKEGLSTLSVSNADDVT